MMAQARARKEPTDSVLGFRKRLAKLMLENKLNERGVAPRRSPNRPRRVSNTPHVLSKRPSSRENLIPSVVSSSV